MIFALGFLFAGLLMLMFLPAIWRRALRLTQRRVEQLLPISMTEVAAERDQLRAQFAIERRRLEQVSEALVETRAKDLAELSRRGARLTTLQAQVETLGARAQALESSLVEAERRAAHAEGVWSALEKEVMDSSALAHRRMEDSIALQRGILAASDLADTRRVQIAGLETQLEALRAELDATQRDLAHTRLQLSEKTSAADLYAKERDFTRSDLVASNTRREALQKEFDALAATLAEREDALRETQRTRTRLSNEMADQARALEAAQAREAELRAQSHATLDAHHDEARKSAERAQELRGERDALQGALEAVRRDAAILRDEAATRPAILPAGDRVDEILRQTISDIGAEVLRLTDALEQQSRQDVDASPAERIQRLQNTAGRASSRV
ncbi:MAG: hypothetical protein Q8M31_00250 [Beijerinckiaceae bacterium]|nr:hypothetical protein [Beijerinckiaceae bacterium]